MRAFRKRLDKPFPRASSSIDQGNAFLVGSAMLTFTLLYFAMVVSTATKMPFRTDEVFVIWMMRYFSAGNIINALKMGLGTAPPGYYWLLHGFTAVLGQTALAIRLPSILGFYVFALSVF